MRAFFHAAERHGLADIRLFGFDSFEGLPETDTCKAPTDSTRMSDFAAGNYACSQDQLRQILLDGGVEMDRVTLTPGFYSDSLTETLKDELALTTAGIVNIDCDLYESTVDVLRFVTSLLRNGTLLLFDDWLAYDAHPNRGEQRACHEWQRRIPRSISPSILSTRGRVSPSSSVC